jgi:hypothetical protein
MPVPSRGEDDERRAEGEERGGVEGPCAGERGGPEHAERQERGENGEVCRGEETRDAGEVGAERVLGGGPEAEGDEAEEEKVEIEDAQAGELEQAEIGEEGGEEAASGGDGEERERDAPGPGSVDGSAAPEQGDLPEKAGSCA